MQLQSGEHQYLESSEFPLSIATELPASEETMTDVSQSSEVTQFYTRYEDSMAMNAAPEVVAAYLDVHEQWFTRCAHPMQVEPLGRYGYALTIGKFGALGYEVEPKIGLELEPQDQGVYRIHTIPVPNYTAPGYDVDFRAVMELAATPEQTTKVQWILDLTVYLQFPRFIRALPQSLIQKTGDRLLHQIVRQVSRRLTHKVQTDFHSTHQLSLPQ